MTSSGDPGEVRILIVDDEIEAATSLSYLLQLLGCRTATAFGSAMGLRIHQLFRPTLVFVDLVMPGDDGIAFLEAAKGLKNDDAVPMFVCLTGHPEEGARARAAGFDLVGIKPMGADALASIIAGARTRSARAEGGLSS